MATDPRKVVTGEVRFSYASVFKMSPTSNNPGAREAYQVTLLIPKTDTATMGRIRKAIAEAERMGAENPKIFNGKIPKNYKNPVIKDGDEPNDDGETKPEEEGCFVIKARTDKNKPGVVDANLNPIIDESEFYSGCYGRASVTFGAYNNEQKGISCYLNNVQKLRDGEPFGVSNSTPEEDFGDMDDDLMG